ncbi:hypothetical protein B0H66DRAFT_596139 [Apodospora peruviana]|uniref:Yeast cell wall synthesis Kre9/Knh1-like N-terminal domain-containing protein n=1 Tax=Apodospora peruviana TaxID=516989 RepID=A0AAE0LY68_9PEZI|nr:hypothetical protein B0H66DRAFT_596139 [Apodospora peruviana]
MATSPGQSSSLYRSKPLTTTTTTTTTTTSTNIIIITILFLLRLATHARAAVTFTNDEYAMQPNEPFTITWEGNRGPVTLTLMNGPDVDLQPVTVIASGLSGTQYTWTPPILLEADGYELQIEDGVSTDYSPRFQFPAPPPPSGSTSSTSTSTTTSPTSSATATNTTIAMPTLTAASGGGAGGLSTAAKAGIGAGIGAGVLLLLGLFGYCMFRIGRRQQTQRNRKGAGSGNPKHQNDDVTSETVFADAEAKKGRWPYNRAPTPFAELGQPEYNPPGELWGGGVDMQERARGERDHDARSRYAGTITSGGSTINQSQGYQDSQHRSRQDEDGGGIKGYHPTVEVYQHSGAEDITPLSGVSGAAGVGRGGSPLSFSSRKYDEVLNQGHGRGI